MNRTSLLLSILIFCLAHGLSANRTSTNYSIGPETFAGLAGDSNSSAYAQFSAVEPLSGLSIKNMPDLKNFAGFIGQLPPLDQDGDGLPDSQEDVLGTDKTLVDTDGDGLTDGEEVSLGTNPLLMDSDGDGYSDFTEAQASTNPLLASSNPNLAPSLIDLNYSAVLENQPPQTVVGRLTAADPDGNSSLSLSLVSKGDGSLFLIDQQDNLITASIFDYESPKKTLSVTVRASDDKNASLEKTFVIQLLNQVEDLDGDGVEDQVDPDRDGDGFSNADELAYGSDPSDPNSVANQAPTGLSLSSDTISENLPAGTVIGVVQAQDADANDTLTYQLVSQSGQTNNPSASPFTLETNGTLLSSLSFDFEQQDQFPVWVRAMDSHGSSVQKDFVIRVLDVNESTPTPTTPEIPSENNQSEPTTANPDDQNQSTEPQGYWPEGVVKNASINEQNVRHIYLAMLAREPDSAASAYWTQSGQLTNSLVGILAESQEFKIRLANGLVNQPAEPSSDNNQSLPITPDPDDQNESTSGEHLAEIISTEVYAEVSASESLFIGVLTESGEMGISINSLSIFKIIDFSGSEVATSNPILSQKDEIINRIQTTLSSGAYTLWVSGDGSTKKPTSIKLTKTAGSAGKFKLFQTRALSTTSTPLTQNIEIAGNGTAKIFAYAQGTQNLQNLGVTNSINDPELQVFSKPVSGGYWTQTASNDNWADSPQASDLQSMSTFNLQSKESGVIANLPKNAHSFQVRDKSDNLSGVAMLSIEFLESSAEHVEDIITDPDPTPSPPADSNETGDTDSELVDHNTTTPTVPKIPGDENPIIDPGSELVNNDQPNPDPSDPIDQNQSTGPEGYWPEGVAKNVQLNEQNIRQIYLAMLGREPDSAGLAYWSQSGQSTNSFVSTLAESQEFKYRLANGLVNQPNEHEESSSENNQSAPTTPDPVDHNQSTEPDGYWPEGVAKDVPLNEQNVRRIYLAMLGREPDSAGLAYWSQSGQSTNYFVDSIAGSGEFQYRLANADNDDPDTPISNPADHMVHPQPPLGVPSAPTDGNETVNTDHNTTTPTTPEIPVDDKPITDPESELVDHDPGAPNPSDSVDQNQSTELDGYWPEGVAKNVPLNEQNVRRIYLTMLGREPDSAGLAYWSQSGQSTNYFVDSIAGSGEFQYRLANADNDDPDTPISNPADHMVHPQPPLGVPSAPTEGNETVNADHNTTTPTTPEIPVDDKPITDPESELVDHDPGAPNPAEPVDQNQSSELDGYWPEGVAKNVPLNEQNVRRIYLAMLGREPDSAGLAYWSQSGELTNFFVNSIAGSGEFQYRLANGLVDQPAVPSSENNQSESVAPGPIDQNQSTEPVQPEPEPLPQVPTFELVENQVSENSPTGSLAGKLLVPDHNGTQTLSFVLSEPSPFELKPNGTLLTKRSFDFESDSGSLPLTITAINDGNQSLELSFTVTLLNVIEDLDGDGFEDAHDPDIDGDGLSNKDEALAGTDPTIEDSDEDELSDGEEIALKTNPLSEDSDQDGLTDGTEIGIGTNPLAKDSDGDGFNDQEEVLAGSFPEDANDYPGQQVVVERDPNEGPDGLLYQLSEKKFTLQEAKTHAVEQNAVIPYLAITDPNTPNDSIGKFLVQFMIRNSTDARPRAWILGENIELYGLIGRAILTQKGPKIAFTGNKKLPVLLGYEKPAVRIPYLITHLPETNGTKVLAKGEIMDDGGEKPFRVGFRISEKILVQENDPTARIVSASLEGNVLEAVVERLEPGTTYYLRTFAENSAGVAYGAFKRIKLTESYDAPFAGKAAGQGWFRSDWFGLFLPANQNWVFHQDFEWIYYGATNQNGIWFWSERIGWSWTREGVWPYLWMNNQSNWTYYFGKKGGQPTFWDYSKQSVFRWRNPVSLVGANDSLPQ